MNKLAAFFVAALTLQALTAAPFAQESPLSEGTVFRRLPSSLESLKPKPTELNASTMSRGLFEAVNETTYVVGPLDQFYVIYGDKKFQTTVNSDGNLVVEAVPPIPVAGLPLLRAKRLVVETVSKQYKGDKVYVTLAQAKTFQISVSGELAHTGFHLMDPGTRLSDAIEKARGFTYMASRKLVLTSPSGERREINLSNYFKNGDLAENPVLNQGDRVYAPPLEFINGFVQVRDSSSTRPLPIESGDNLEAVLFRHFNFSNAEEWHVVRVYRNEKLHAVIPRQDAASYTPINGDVLEVHNPVTKVFVGGTVIQPGEIRYDPRLKISDYIARSGITINTSRNFKQAVVISADGKTRSPKSSDDPIFPGDHIWVPRSTEAKTRDYLILITSISNLAVAIGTLYVISTQ